METEAQEKEWRCITPERPGGRGGLASERQARQWLLVLAARGIPHREERQARGWRIEVPAERHAEALRELTAYEEENRNWPPPLPPVSPLLDNRWATLSILALLATFHNLTQLPLDLAGHHPVDWVALGNAAAGKIRNGELWRTVTALTLHTDWLHLGSNLVLGGLFALRLARDLGSGLAWSLILLSGMLGNGLNALLQPGAHQAIGASTAVFGAVGLLAAINWWRYRTALRRRWPLPLAAGLALLALLGAGGENTDLGAHLFGFLAGIGLGAALAFRRDHHGRLTPGADALLAVACAVVVAGAWSAALL